MELYSKEELLKELKKEYSCGGECDHCPEVLDAGSCSVLRCIRRIIDNAPTVDMNTELSVAYLKGRRQGQSEERPQGEWVVQKLQNGFDDVYCPYCNARPTRGEYGYYLRDNFCHECGADMRKGGKK